MRRLPQARAHVVDVLFVAASTELCLWSCSATARNGRPATHGLRLAPIVACRSRRARPDPREVRYLNGRTRRPSPVGRAVARRAVVHVTPLTRPLPVTRQRTGHARPAGFRGISRGGASGSDTRGVYKYAFYVVSARGSCVRPGGRNPHTRYIAIHRAGLKLYGKDTAARER